MKKNKSTSIALHLIKIEDDGMHLLAKVKINNKTARLVVDSGASRTVLDKNRIHRFVKENKFEKHESVSTGLGTNTMESHIVEIKKLKIGNWTLEEIIWVLLDLSHVNASYVQMGIKEIDGVLGGDILMKYNALIDYGNKKLILKMK